MQERKIANVISLQGRSAMSYCYVGVDVGKFFLDIQLGESWVHVENNFAEFNKIKKKLDAYRKLVKKEVVIVCEASGGYEREVMSYFREQNYMTHVAHAKRVREFAKSKGYLAKTDKLDAKVITEYAETMILQPDKVMHSKEAEKIEELLKRRDQLMKDKLREENHLEKKGGNDFIKKSIHTHLDWLKEEIKKVEAEIKKVNQASEEIRRKTALLTSVPGIGKLTANYCIAFLPELGHENSKQIAGLVGVAPYNNDSGKRKGKRFIQGGRKTLRNLLYMAALTSIRCNPDLKMFYERLKTKGKPFKVILIAVLRKLLMLMNSIMSRGYKWEQKPPLKA